MVSIERRGVTSQKFKRELMRLVSLLRKNEVKKKNALAKNQAVIANW